MPKGGPIETPFRAPSNLPGQLNKFVGREHEMLQVRELLGSTRLLTLTGAGGCGKTRLALEVAGRALHDYPDGVWLAELAPVIDPTVLAQRLVDVFMVANVSGRTPLELLAEHLRTKRALLLLDNCEHIVDACALVAQSLLESCPALNIVATSRETLTIPGEVIWRVPSLRLPERGLEHDLPALSASEAVALFIDRARAVQPKFALTAENAEAVVQICARLDGIPLAIELAAARVRLIPVDQIRSRLNDRLGLLTAGSRTALPRQQTLRASIDWSYSLLTEIEQILFRRLSVFAGSVALDAVERVCSGDGFEATRALDVLGRLADKSVLIAETEDSGVARFWLLETLRQYGRERLVEAGESETMERRHCDYYIALSEAAQIGLNGTSQAAWLERLDEEHDNLQRALSWCVEHDLEIAQRMTVALSDFWVERGHTSEARSWLGAVLQVATNPSVARAQSLMVAGNVAYHQADYAAARSYLEESLAIWRHAGDRRGQGWSLVGLGAVAIGEGDAEKSLGPLRDGLSLCREAEDADGMSRALFQLGMVAAMRGDVEEADRLGVEGSAVSRRTGNAMAISRAIHHSGVVAFLRHDRAAMRSLNEEGLMISRNLRSPIGIALGLERSAVMAETDQRHETALKLAGAASALRAAAHAGVGAPWTAAVAQLLEPARQALGAEVADASWNEGVRMTMEEAVTYALSAGREEVTKAKTPKGRDPFALTRREQAIAALVAEGLTNRLIAERLFVSKRTAETHIQHILNKLGLNSRAQIAVWAVRQQLVSTSQK